MAAVLGVAELLKGKARKRPNRLIRVNFLHPLHKRKQSFLIGGFRGLAAQKGKPLDIIGRQQGDYMILGFLGEGLAVVEIPGMGLKAALAAIGTARNKKGHPHPVAVGNIAIFNFSVMQGLTPLSENKGGFRPLKIYRCNTLSFIS